MTNYRYVTEIFIFLSITPWEKSKQFISSSIKKWELKTYLLNEIVLWVKSQKDNPYTINCLPWNSSDRDYPPVHIQIVYYNCVKFHQYGANEGLCLQGTWIDRQIDRRTKGWLLYTHKKHIWGCIIIWCSAYLGSCWYPPAYLLYLKRIRWQVSVYVRKHSSTSRLPGLSLFRSGTVEWTVRSFLEGVGACKNKNN